MVKFSDLIEMAQQCFDCARKANRINNLYFSRNLIKRYFVRRNFINIIGSLGIVTGGDSCLDFGPGMGIMIPALARRFRHVVALDIDQKQLKSAKELISKCDIGNVEFVLGKEENELGIFEDGKFDCIIADNVLEHIENTAPIISEFYRILNEKGVLIISVPSQNFIYRMFENENDGHVLRTHSQITDLIGKIGHLYSQIHEFDVFPFFKTCVFMK